MTLPHFQGTSPLAAPGLFPSRQPGRALPLQSLEEEAVDVLGLP